MSVSCLPLAPSSGTVDCFPWLCLYLLLLRNPKPRVHFFFFPAFVFFVIGHILTSRRHEIGELHILSHGKFPIILSYFTWPKPIITSNHLPHLTLLSLSGNDIIPLISFKFPAWHSLLDLCPIHGLAFSTSSSICL